MEDFDTRILVDAKEEYSKELIRVLKRYMLEGIESLYQQACELCHKNRSKTIITFQDLLEQIPKWNQELIEKETNRIIENSKCEFFEDLITAVFVSHTKILAAIRTNKKNKRINLTIPKPETFVHKCYIEIAREFWKSPCMFDKKVNNFEQQRNNKYCEEIISICIQETIRKLLPLKYILKESLGESYDDEQSIDSEDITRSISKSDENNLKKLVQNEIKNHYSVNTDLNDSENYSTDKKLDMFDNDLFFSEKEKNIELNKKEEDTEKENKKEEDTEKENKKEEDKEEEKEYKKEEKEYKKEEHQEEEKEYIKKEEESKKEENKEEYEKKKDDERLVKDIKIQDGGNSIFSSNNNLQTNISKVESSGDTNNTININTSDEKSSDEKSSIENEKTIDIKSNESLLSGLNQNDSTNEINVNSIEISDVNTDLNDISMTDNSLNELDIGSLIKNDSVVNLDGNYNMVDSNDMYNNLNKETTIKSDVMKDFNNNLRNDSRPNLFDDAPLTD